MRIYNMVWLLFWLLQIPKVFGIFTGFLTRREILSMSVVTSGLGLIGAISWEVVKGPDWQEIFVGVWGFLFYQDYKNWKKHKDDDDDEHRKKRWSWVKNKLPKPKTKAIPQPI